MTIEIRPPAEDELRAAMTAAEVAFGRGVLEDDDWERESKALPASRALAAFDAGKPVGARRRLQVRPDRPGRPAAVRGRHLGRRDADAPPPGDPARLHEAPARGRAGLGRADRGAVGLRGRDLRPLRLRAGGAGRAHEVGLRALRAPGRRGRGLGPARRRRQGARALLAGLRTRPRRPRGDAHRATSAGGRSTGSPTRRAGVAARAGSSTPPSRSTAGSRATRSTASRTTGRTASPVGEVRVIEAFATTPAAERRALALPARDRPDGRGRWPTASTRRRRCRCSSATRARSGCGSATVSGCGSSISTRR